MKFCAPPNVSYFSDGPRCGAVTSLYPRDLSTFTIKMDFCFPTCRDQIVPIRRVRPRPFIREYDTLCRVYDYVKRIGLLSLFTQYPALLRTSATDRERPRVSSLLSTSFFRATIDDSPPVDVVFVDDVFKRSNSLAHIALYCTATTSIAPTRR